MPPVSDQVDHGHESQTPELVLMSQAANNLGHVAPPSLLSLDVQEAMECYKDCFLLLRGCQYYCLSQANFLSRTAPNILIFCIPKICQATNVAVAIQMFMFLWCGLYLESAMLAHISCK
jgi:hypothetical protein